MHGDSTFHDALADLNGAGWIDDVLYEVKSGKEATVFCCRAGVRAAEVLRSSSRAGRGTSSSMSNESGERFVAAKVHRDLQSRRFKNDAIYQTGRVHLAREGRAKRASDNKSAFGRQVQYAMWIEHEWESLNLLSQAGLDVPTPIARTDRTVLMSYAGDADRAAPNLLEADVPRTGAPHVFARIMDNVEAMLDLDRVHGDLSPYNILWWNDRPMIIDFPQAVDPRLNPAARTLLERDVTNVCEWARKRDVACDAGRISRALWRRFVLGEIG